jgi:hypothetical protein
VTTGGREGRMTVRFFPGTKKQKTTLIAGFLTQFHVEHELVDAQDAPLHTVHLGTEPALEVNGRLFVDPNVDALKKILKVN